MMVFSLILFLIDSAKKKFMSPFLMINDLLDHMLWTVFWKNVLSKIEMCVCELLNRETVFLITSQRGSVLEI